MQRPSMRTGLRDDRAEPVRVNGAVVGPLGEVKNDVGALGRVVDRVRVPEVGANAGRVRHGDRVVDGDDRALVGEAAGDGKAGRVADVIAVGLERGAEHGDALARQVTADGGARQGDDPVAAAEVDGRPRWSAGPRATSTPLSCAVARKARMSFGRQPPPKPRPGERNLRPIRSSMPIASASLITSAPEASHISAITLIKEILVARNELAATFTSSAVSRSMVSAGNARGKRGRVDRAHELVGGIGRDAEHDAVRGQAVLHRVALTEELGVERVARPGRPRGPPRGPAR